MRKLYLGVLLLVILALCSACSNASIKNAGEEVKDSVASVMDSQNKYVQIVKNGYRANNPDLTYDKAFSAFFGSPQWKYFKGNEEKEVVEFTGDCTYQDAPVKARIQFVVDEKQGTFEATYLALNEVPQNKLILASLIEKAFMTNPTQAQNVEQEKSDGNNSAIEDSSKEAGMKYSHAEAEKRINAWLGEHEFPGVQHLNLDPGTADGKMFELSGTKYHRFILSGLHRAIDILVDPYTGELFFYDTGLKPQSLNQWYVEYRKSHK
jgi:hypothetical protein